MDTIDDNSIECILNFLGEESYVYVATLNTNFKVLWRNKPKITRVIAKETTKELLDLAFKTGLPKTSQISSRLALLNKPNLLDCCVENMCVFNYSMCEDACRNGHLKVYWWGLYRGFYCDKRESYEATNGDHNTTFI